VAARQYATLTTLITLARGFTAPLPGNSANNALKELLKTAEVTVEKRNRVVIKATLSPSLFTSTAQDENSSQQHAPSAAPSASK